MYLDTILFMSSYLLLFLAFIMMLYLFFTRKSGKVYQTVLKQDAEFSETFVATVFSSFRTESAGTERAMTDLVTVVGDPDDARTVVDVVSGNGSGDPIEDFDASALEGRYILKREIHGGGMSRVFVAESAKLGNEWIVKFIPNTGNHLKELVNEVEILRRLNHINLPKIVDVFYDAKGIYIVESYIHGYQLNRIMQTVDSVNPAIVLDWAIQLTQVLNYLHTMEPKAIYHFDLKPSNVIVTPDNKLVLIDFGISRDERQGESSIQAVTYRYAAPEQLKHRVPEKYAEMIFDRIGGALPEARLGWKADARTDLYSLGVMLSELVTGQLPSKASAAYMKEAVPKEFAKVIAKCMEADPAKRYQSAEALLFRLLELKKEKTKMLRAVWYRKLALLTALSSLVLSAGVYFSGYQVYAQETGALLDILPDHVLVSLQQSQGFIIEKHLPNGTLEHLTGKDIRWDAVQNNVAKIEGDRVYGINTGSSVITGTYRNKTVALGVEVVEPMDGVVDISLRYVSGKKASTWIHSDERDIADGEISKAGLVSPESVCTTEKGDIFFSDSGRLRRIREGRVETLKIPESRFGVKSVRAHQGDLYVLTDEWQDADNQYLCAILKITHPDGWNSGSAEIGVEVLHTFETKFVDIADFLVSDIGIVTLEKNYALGGCVLRRYDADQAEELCIVEPGASSIAMGERKEIYISNAELGMIQRYLDGELSYFAGVSSERSFTDGGSPLFYSPLKIKYHNGSLYVLDFNVIRCVELKDGVAVSSYTVAGEPDPNFERTISGNEYNADDIVFAHSLESDFVLFHDKIILTEPKRSAIWQVEQ